MEPKKKRRHGIRTRNRSHICFRGTYVSKLRYPMLVPMWHACEKSFKRPFGRNVIGIQRNFCWPDQVLYLLQKQSKYKKNTPKNGF